MFEQLMNFLNMLPDPLAGLVHAVFMYFGVWCIIRGVKLLWDILPVA